MLSGMLEPGCDRRTLSLMVQRVSVSHALLCAIAVLVCCLVFYGANSVRGTDQFWYLADVETIMDGGPPISNTYFPGTLLRGNVGPDNPNFFYHNGPMIHLSAFVGEYTGAYRAWILINLACHFLVALAIFLGARQLTTFATATTVSALYLMSPLALWQSMSMLLEQYLAGVMAMVVIGYLYKNTGVGKLLFGCGIVVGAVSHPIFVAIGLAAAVALALTGHLRSDYLMLVAGVVAMVCVLVLGHITGDLYPTSFFPELGIAIANVLPTEPSMLWYFSEQGYSINVKNLFSKIIEAFARQFTDPLSWPFNIFTNLSIAIWGWLFMVSRNRYRALLVASGIVLLLYFGLITMMQHQVRYQQMISPVVFILIAIAAGKFPVARNKAFIAIVFVFAAITGAYLSNLSHQKALLASDTRELQTVVDFVEPEAKIIAYDCDCDQRLSYLLKPRPVLNIRSRYLDDAAQLRVVSIFEPDYFVSGTALPENEFVGLTLVKSLTDPVHGRLYWYRVDNESETFAIHTFSPDFLM